MEKNEKINVRNLIIIGTKHKRTTNKKDRKDKQNFTYVKCYECEGYGCSICNKTGTIKI